MVASTSYTYDTDPDILAFKPTNKPSDLIPTVAPKKSTMYGKNPNLQYNDYENDPDIEAFTPGKHNVNAINTTNVSTPEEHSKLLTYLKDRKKSQDFFANQLGGVVEPALSVISGTIAKPVGQAFGVLNNLISPQYGTQEGIKRGEKIAEDIQEQFTYKPRTEAGQQNLESLSKGLETLTGGSPLPEVQVVAPTVSPAVSQLKDQFRKVKGAIPKVRIETVPSGLQSAGAAAANHPEVLQGNINAALAEASPGLQEHVQAHPAERINISALETRALEEKHGIDLTQGQRTNNLNQYVNEWDNRGTTEVLGEHFKEQPHQLSNAFEKSKLRHAPDIPSTADASELGQHEINALTEKDAQRKANISAAYKALEDQNGGQFPIDLGTLQDNIKNSLSKSLKTSRVTSEMQADLNDFYKNPTFESYEALRTNLANDMRNGPLNNRGAAYIIRQELENLPIFGEEGNNPQAMQLKSLADNARALYRERQNVIKSNPAYKAAIREAADLQEAASEGESLNAAKFHNKYVSTATPEAIRRMKAEIPQDHIAHQAITFGELERAKNSVANPNATRIKADTFAEFMRKNAPALKESLSPEAMKDVMEIGLLSSKIAKPEAGTFSHSNTYSALLRDLAKQGVSTGLESTLATATGGKSIIPVGIAKQMYQKMTKESFAKEATHPYAGIVNKE